MKKAKASSIPLDYSSPDLDRVLKAIRETHRPKKDRRERAVALLRCLSRDWRRLRAHTTVRGVHRTPKYEMERGEHTAAWLDQLKDAAWLPVGRDRFRTPGDTALRSPETATMYRAEDFVSGIGADEIDSGLATALGLTATVRVSDLVSRLEEMRDDPESFDVARVRLAYQHLARVAPKSWTDTTIGDMPLSSFRTRFAARSGLVLVLGTGGAAWRQPVQVRRGRRILPDDERYVIDDAFRGLWNVLQIADTGLADCMDYLKEHADRFGPEDEDGILIQVYRYMSDLLEKNASPPSPAIRHIPLACTGEWRARRPILLVENAALREQLAAARPSSFFWRPPCDTRPLGPLVRALSVTQVEPRIRPILDARSIEAGEDLLTTFGAAVDHLSDTLGRTDAALRSALTVPWEELKRLTLRVYDDLVPVEVEDDAVGGAVNVSLRAHLRRQPLELHCTEDALASREDVGHLIARLFDPKVPYPFDAEWALAWQAAERSEAAALRFTTDDAAHSQKVAATAAELAAKAGGTVKLKQSDTGTGKKTPSPPPRQLKDFQPGISSVTVVEGSKPPPPKGPIRKKLSRRRRPSDPNGNARAPNSDYSNNQLEDFGWSVVAHVLERGTGTVLEDFRRRHNVGADGAFDWDEFVELKATGRSMRTSVGFSASEYARALESGNKYLLALVYQCEKGSPTRVKLIFDPARRTTIRETEAVRLSNLGDAAGIVVELGEDGSIVTVAGDPSLVAEPNAPDAS